MMNEYEAKRFLAGYGIPVIAERLVQDAKTAAEEAVQLGFPVVLKVVGEKLAHKTELGGVVLNLRSAEDVCSAAERLLQIPNCQGLLVQKMAAGSRELVCGMARDPHFGQSVMFGLGGVLTEALDDVVFRLAPLSKRDAREMIGEIRGSRALGAVRGEAAVDLEILATILVALGEAGLQHEEIIAIDINPLIIQPDGKPVAVDALVVQER
jgi:succinyl-CoA synthetase beta subunit